MRLSRFPVLWFFVLAYVLQGVGQWVHFFVSRRIIAGMPAGATFDDPPIRTWLTCAFYITNVGPSLAALLLTLCFSKKLRNLEAAFAMFAAYYNYCWRTRKPGKSGKKRPTAAMMANLTDHLWGFDELFDAVLQPAMQGERS
jgi:hypothetical protein